MLTGRQRGFTLVELLVTLMVAAVLVSLAVPSFRTFIQNNELASVTNNLVTALQYARSEAIKRGDTVRVVATSATSSDEWGGGWQVRDAGGTVLRAGDGTDEASLDSTNDITQLAYGASGFVDNSDTIDVCIASGREGRRIQLALSGRTYIQTIANCP